MNFQDIIFLHPYLDCVNPPFLHTAKTNTMSIIQDKLGNEFLRNGGMDPNFTPGMLMFSHLPPVTSFTRLTSQSVMGELPQEMTLKKERDSPPDLQGSTINTGGFLHSMGIKQERLSELDYRMPMYGTGGGVGMNCLGGGAGKSDADMPDMSFSNHHPNHHNMLLHDLSLSNVRPLGEPVRGSGQRPQRLSLPCMSERVFIVFLFCFVFLSHLCPCCGSCICLLLKCFTWLYCLFCRCLKDR